MKLSGVKFSSISSYSGIQISNKNTKQENPNSNKDLIISSSIWGTPNKPLFKFNPYFAGVDLAPQLPIDHEKSSNFKICNIDGLTCPSCGIPMLPRPIFDEVFKSDLDSVPEEEYINVLKEYEPYMTQVEANVFDKIQKEAKKHPGSSLSELLIELRDEELPKLESIQFKKLEYMNNIATSVPKIQRDELYRALTNAEEKIKNRSPKHPFRRKQFVETIQKLKIHNRNTKDMLVKVAESFPSSNEAECAWIVKYSGIDKKHNKRSNREIAERFLINAKTNTDHMKAQDLGGKDSIYNYMAMHSGCNSDKTNKTFMEWFNENPEERFVFIQQYFNEVQEAIEKGEIDDERYIDYTQRAIETIRKLSGGKLNFVCNHPAHSCSFGS